MIITKGLDLKNNKQRNAKALINFIEAVKNTKPEGDFTCYGMWIRAYVLLNENDYLEFVLGYLLGKALNFGYKGKFLLYYDSLDPNDNISIKNIKRKKKLKKQNIKMKIKFKDISSVDLSKVFPPISNEEYKLLSDQEMVLDGRTYEQFQKNNYLDLSDFKVSADLIETFEDESLSVTQQKVQDIVSEKFIHSEEVVDVLMAGIENKKNVILYGRGGHGKSEMTELVLKSLQEMNILKAPPFVQSFGDGLTDDKLFGGTDIIKYRKEGIIEYLLHNSFLEHEVVVFEEIFDAPAQVLLQLKDIMTSGYYRNGNVIYPCKTKTFIGLTNKSKEEFSNDNDSLKALAERFPLTLKVEWTHYKKTNFIKLFKTVLGTDYYNKYSDKLSTLCDIIDMNNMNGSSFVSPRTAVVAAQLFCKGKDLRYISDIDPNILDDYNKKKKNDIYSVKNNNFLKEINSYIDKHELELIGEEHEEFLSMLNEVNEDIQGKSLDLDNFNTSSKEVKTIKINKINFLLSIVNRLNYADDNIKNFTDLKKRLNKINSDLKQSMKDLDKAVGENEIQTADMKNES